MKEIVAKFDDVKEAQIYAAWCSAMLLDLLTIQWPAKGTTPEETVEAADDLEEWATKMQTMKV